MDSNPTYFATNHDMNGLKTMQMLDIDGIHILSTCHINYKGKRVIAQSIIPGILSNTEQSDLTEYGSVDEGNTIFKSEEFDKIMKTLYDLLSIK